MSDESQGPGWWLANDGKWYPPEQAHLPDPPRVAAIGSAEKGGPDWWWSYQDRAWFAPGDVSPSGETNAQLVQQKKRSNLIALGVVGAVLAVGFLAVMMLGGTGRDLDRRWDEMSSSQRADVCTVYRLGGGGAVVDAIMDGNSDASRSEVVDWVDGTMPTECG